jgi:hypothetical protein
MRMERERRGGDGKMGRWERGIVRDGMAWVGMGDTG